MPEPTTETALVPMNGHNQLTVAPSTLAELMRFAEMIAPSSLVPEAFRGKPADVLVAMMRGKELGFSYMQSLYAFYVIKGKAGLYADAIVALALQHPKCKFFMLVDSTDTVSTYRTLREGMPEPVTFSYTIEMARTAQLTSNPTYRTHPASMLRARASAALGRACYPDKLLGIYVDDEIDEIAKNIREKAAMPALPIDEARSIETTARPAEKPALAPPTSLAARMQRKPTQTHRPAMESVLAGEASESRGGPSPAVPAPSQDDLALDYDALGDLQGESFVAEWSDVFTQAASLDALVKAGHESVREADRIGIDQALRDELKARYAVRKQELCS